MVAEDGREDENDPTAKPVETETPQKPASLHRNLGFVYGTCWMHCFTHMLAAQADMLMWLDHFNGDFPAQSRMVSLCWTLERVLGMVLNPILASLCDVAGRKPVILSGQMAEFFTNLLRALRPTSGSLLVAGGLSSFAATEVLGSYTLLGDIFKGDGVGYGGAQAKIMVGIWGSMVFCPILALKLMQRVGKSGPYAVAALVEFGAMITTWLFVQETLQEKGSLKDFKFRSSSPLSFLKLFGESPRLSLLTVMHIINSSCERMPMYQAQENYNQEILKFSTGERAKWLSFVSINAFPSYALAGTFMKKLGTSACVWLGASMHTLFQFLQSRVRQRFTFCAILPLGMLRPAVSNSIIGMMQDEIRKVGMKQGEFQGCLSNIKTLTEAVPLTLWGKLYAYGYKKGKPQLFLYVAMLCNVAQMLLERCISRLEDSASRKTVLKAPERRASWLLGPKV